jgi:citrate synthase
MQRESEITLMSEKGPYYRGRNAIELAETASLEQVAALLWEIDEADIANTPPPRSSRNFAEIDAAMAAATSVERALAHFSFFEHANPRSFDLTPNGMARTGIDVIRWLTAILLRRSEFSADPVHLQFGKALGLPDDLTDLVRRLLVLSADHGLEQSTFVVRAMASTGVTPWRAVAAGLMVSVGRRTRFGYGDAVRRFLGDILTASNPEEPIIRRVREGEDLPGFASSVYSQGDPRAAAMLDHCDRVFANDDGYRRFQQALHLAFELRQLKPAFGLVAGFIGERLGFVDLAPSNALAAPELPPFLVGRSVGWVAHAIEQYRVGEAERQELVYRGRLPDRL